MWTEEEEDEEEDEEEEKEEEEEDSFWPGLQWAVFLRCQLNPILNPSGTLNSKFPPSLKNGQIMDFPFYVIPKP